MKANLTDIMESIQGEGLLIGSRQVFLRFTGCNLRCSYCDTPASFEAQPFCLISKYTGRGEVWDEIPNPFSVDQLITLIKQYSSQWISLTGGEPLLWSNFIQELSGKLKMQGYKFLLETNGTMYEQLDICLPYIDLISMDFKLPSATGLDCSELHRRFLLRAQNTMLYIKIVIDAQTKKEEVQEAVNIIAAVDPGITVVLQPVTPVAGIFAPDNAVLLDLQKICQEKILDVRIIPQIHKYMGFI